MDSNTRYVRLSLLGRINPGSGVGIGFGEVAFATAAAVPEPSSFLLLGSIFSLGAVITGVAKRNRLRKLKPNVTSA